MSDQATLDRLRGRAGTDLIVMVCTSANDRSPHLSGLKSRRDRGGKVLNFSAPTTISVWPIIRRLLMPPNRRSIEYGFGMASVRFICGTQDLHKRLEKNHSRILRQRTTVFFMQPASMPMVDCFEPLLGPEDAIISDQLNHASIIDGIRLCKADRHRYPNSDMDALEKIPAADPGQANPADCHRWTYFRWTAMSPSWTRSLRWRKNTMPWSWSTIGHATGFFFGPTGRGSAEYPRRHGTRSISLPRRWARHWAAAWAALTVASQPVIDILRQRSRPYLFSNSLAPPLVAASIKVFEMLNESTALRDRLEENTRYFRKAMTDAGFDIKAGRPSPIVRSCSTTHRLPRKWPTNC